MNGVSGVFLTLRRPILIVVNYRLFLFLQLTMSSLTTDGNLGGDEGLPDINNIILRNYKTVSNQEIVAKVEQIRMIQRESHKALSRIMAEIAQRASTHAESQKVKTSNQEVSGLEGQIILWGELSENKTWLMRWMNRQFPGCLIFEKTNGNFLDFHMPEAKCED